jgi:neurotransmitter:Na+ symporter, NSS family
MSDNTNHQQWSSKWAFILATTGAAVGLGNIWRFPYLLGSQGGSAFLLLYVLFLLILGMPILMCEILLGRHTRKNAINALASLANDHKHSPKWQSIGWAGAISLLMVLAFYSVISGMCMYYFWHTLTTGFQHSALPPTQVWDNLLNSPWKLTLWHSVFMALTIGVILLGVQKGLERATKWMMPALYIVLIALVIYAIHYGDLHRTLQFLFDFNIDKITIHSVTMALGQAFFSLALGAGAMVAYGAYAPQNTSIPFAVTVVTVLELLVALLAGLAIYPLMYAYNIPVDTAGYGLMFTALPHAFAVIPAGNLVGATFFLTLIFAAWTSSINLCEPLVLLLIQKWQWSRKTATVLIGCLAWSIGLLSLLSFNVLSHVTLANQNILYWNINIPTNILLPLGGLGYALFTGWILPKKISQQEINTPWLYPIWLFLVRFIAPLAIICIFITNLIN